MDIKNLSDSDKRLITLKYNNLHRYNKNWNTYKHIDTMNTINDIEKTILDIETYVGVLYDDLAYYSTNSNKCYKPIPVIAPQLDID